jgi:putative transcriptional regulator
MGRHHPKLLNNLEIVRRRSDLTQAQLSQAAGVSRKSIKAIENGLYVPSTVLSLKIARALECEVEDLFRLP